MIPSENEISQHDRLRANPTARTWRLELDYLLSRARDAAIMEIGSPRQYVRRLLVDARDPIVAKIAFEKALHVVISAWIPEEMLQPYNVLLLELITAYTPRGAFKKILSRLSLHGQLARVDPIRGPEDPSVTILALVALEAYYPSPPDHPEKDKGFDSYISLLRSIADKNGTAPHAFRRLIELRSLSLSDPEARAILNKDGVIDEFLQYSLGPHRKLLEVHLGALFALCLNTRSHQGAEHPYPKFKEFRESLQFYGADILEEPRGSGNLVILLSSGVAVSMPTNRQTLLGAC